MFVVGTAGHIDHGKSALVRTHTGIDPDRLPEEKARGMTIDLGFAWLTLPSGDSVGIVDVPGHERFIKNMVAGVGAIDAVIFVIAADDGWMPQTSEHLDILKLLGIKTGLVALTKVDLVDSEYLEMQKKDIAARLAGSFLERAPIIPFSTRANIGKREIIAALQDILQRHITRITYDSPRLYIDRSFTIKGIGTVVTGTLIEGELRTGQEVEICPSGVRSRIRSLQTHKQSIQVAVPGSRVAVGITGLSTQEAPRGAALVYPGFFRPTDTIGVQLRVLPNIGLPVKNNEQAYFLLGTSITFGRIRLFEGAAVAPGGQALASIYLNDKICCRLADRFIIRRISPQMTIGGGIILDWNFGQLKLKKARQLQLLESRRNLDIASVVNTELIKDDKLDSSFLKLNSCFTSAQIDKYIADSVSVVQKGAAIADKSQYDKYIEPAIQALAEDHALRPWAPGMNIGDFSRKLRIPAWKASDIVNYLISTGKFAQISGLIKLAEHEPHLTPSQKQLSGKLFAILSASPLAAPSKKDFIAEDPAYEVVINFLRDKGELVELKGELLFTASDFAEISEKIVKLIGAEKKVTASRIKDYLNTTRKYIIPILERLDALEITKREGDFRVLGEKP
ncbi:MAG: selenocysteine-specific translation elongation factor [candidate division Zixibacteria bacterium]|nr:selenocysteine-specific translation elongation factor [candidate division Zixibacteria bacterium]